MQCLQTCPIDVRSLAAKHITIVGGIATVPGLHYRIQQDLHSAAVEVLPTSYKGLSKLLAGAKVVSCPIRTDTQTWVGGSIIGALDGENDITTPMSLGTSPMFSPGYGGSDSQLSSFTKSGQNQDTKDEEEGIHELLAQLHDWSLTDGLSVPGAREKEESRT